MDVFNALPSQHIMPKLVAKGLLERIIVDNILVAEDALPKFV